jgi:hypothetical protein
MGAMVIDMNETRLCALEQLRAFLEGTGEVRFQSVADDEGRYSHLQAVLKRFAYPRLKRANKGLVLRYLGRTTGYSRQQLTRLVRQCLATGGLTKRYRPPAQGFARKYTAADVALLAETDALHDTLSGPATKHLMQRAWLVFVDTRYARLAFISVAHLYNLRAAAGYRARRQQWAKTRPTGIAIGERRAPQPDGHPGYLRIDSVHQGDEDGVKGVYHINVVDCVTQWEGVATCERLSEAYLLPVIEALLDNFPFQSVASTRTMARSTSITGSLACWRSSASSSPSLARAIRTTTAWRRPRTAPSYASASATATSRSVLRTKSMSSVPRTSTPTSTSTGPACLPRTPLMPRAR